MPGFPGAQINSGLRELLLSFQAIACSRPPEPITSIFITERFYPAADSSESWQQIDSRELSKHYRRPITEGRLAAAKWMTQAIPGARKTTPRMVVMLRTSSP